MGPHLRIVLHSRSSSGPHFTMCVEPNAAGHPATQPLYVRVAGTSKWVRHPESQGLAMRPGERRHALPVRTCLCFSVCPCVSLCVFVSASCLSVLLSLCSSLCVPLCVSVGVFVVVCLPVSLRVCVYPPFFLPSFVLMTACPREWLRVCDLPDACVCLHVCWAGGSWRSLFADVCFLFWMTVRGLLRHRTVGDGSDVDDVSVGGLRPGFDSHLFAVNSTARQTHTHTHRHTHTHTHARHKALRHTNTQRYIQHTLTHVRTLALQGMVLARV